MAWLENYTWSIEQGIDARLELKLYSDELKTQPWTFTGWIMYGFISNRTRSEIVQLDMSLSVAATGSLIAILPEANVNALTIGREYFFDLLGIAPGANPADDHHIAFGQAVPLFRSARRPA